MKKKMMMKWVLLAGLAGPTLFATTCGTQLVDAVTGAGISYVGSLVSSILGATLP